jgi:hypothetical protein
MKINTSNSINRQFTPHSTGEKSGWWKSGKNATREICGLI